MAETTGAGPLDPLTGSMTAADVSGEGRRARGWGFGEALARQVLGIILEVLDAPGLPDESKQRLRRSLDEHRDHPEWVLAEHLLCTRSSQWS
ncbi:hypothetical protein [Sinomonas atrocyanea]